MATTTRVLSASVNGTVYTTNANGALEAIDTCHSGATAPTDELANGKFWLDTTTTPGILKIYNNATWEVVLTATGASQTKLDGIEAGADVTDVTNVTAAGALMDSEVDADIKTLVLPASTTISTFGASLVDDTTAPNARTTLGLGALSTSNTVNLASEVAGTLALSSFAGYNSGTGITVNNSTGDVTSNVTSGDATIPLFDGSAATGNLDLYNGNATSTILAGGTNGRYFLIVFKGASNSWPSRTISMNGTNSWMQRTGVRTNSTNIGIVDNTSPVARGANSLVATGTNGNSSAGMYVHGFVQAGTNMRGTAVSTSIGSYWDA